MKSVQDAWLSVSATTRAPRTGEVDGTHYFFKSEPEFEHLIKTDALLEWAEYNGNFYGTPKGVVMQKISEGVQVVLEIEVQGAAQVKQKFPEAHLVFIEPPSLEVLEARLVQRGTESAQVIEKRIETAKIELEKKGEYDLRIVNENLDMAANELITYVNNCADAK